MNRVPLGLGYWGTVFDNIREVATHGTSGEIALIYTLLKSGCEELAKVINNEDIENQANPHVDIRQNNFGRDATVNLGATMASLNA